MRNLLTITLMSILSVGCSSTTNVPLKEKDKAYFEFIQAESLASVEKINGFKLHSWKALSDKYLIITATHNKDYLVETKSRCFNLSSSHYIKLNRSSTMSVNTYSDYISPTNDFSDKCFIKSIYPITDTQMDYMVSIAKPTSNKS